MRDKPFYFSTSAVVALSLLVLSGFLKARTEVIKRNNGKNLAILNAALPGFNQGRVAGLRQEMRDLEAGLTDLSYIFDPKERWFKKDYDLSIYFIEELGEVNRFLKQKALEKQVNPVDLGFKEKIPPESEAIYLLSQLYGLKEVLSLGMDYGINFKSVGPEGMKEQGGIPGIKVVKSRMKLTCPAQGLIEFMIQLTEHVPLVSLESFSAKLVEGSFFEVDLALAHLVIEPSLLGILEPQKPSLSLLKKISLEQQDFIKSLRSKNPFFVANTKEALSLPQTEIILGQPKAFVRFFYRGKAKLKAKEVVVIEDTLNQETVFLALQEKLGNLVLKDFSDEQIILENLDDGKQIIIKKEQ